MGYFVVPSENYGEATRINFYVKLKLTKRFKYMPIITYIVNKFTTDLVDSKKTELTENYLKNRRKTDKI